MLKLSIILSLVFVIQANSLAKPQEHLSFAIFDGLSCSTCEGVMNVVSNQINMTKFHEMSGGIDFAEKGKAALKLAIKGACAYYTLGVPPALALCTAMTGKIADFLADDVIGRSMSIVPKSNCRSIGMCPPCKSTNNKFVMVQKKPALPLPWDNNKHQHVSMWKKYEAEQIKKRRLHFPPMSNKLIGWIPSPKALLGDAKAMAEDAAFRASCYGCKSVMGLVGRDITNVRASGREMLVSLIKQQCLSYVTGIPFSNNICETMAQKSIGKLADSIMGKGEILPGPNCRTIGMCPECTGTCKDDEDIENGKKAKPTPLPSVDDSCDEPPITSGIPCTDNYPGQCKAGNTTCSTPVYERMMRMECMFTCVCRWLPKFSDLTYYLPGK